MSDKPTGDPHPELTNASETSPARLTRQRAEALRPRPAGPAAGPTLKRRRAHKTVFVFTSDNGYFLGEHRIRKGKIKPHEPSIRVPLVIAGPGIPHGERYDPITTPGLTATVADLANVAGRMPFAPDGVSVVPTLRQDQGWKVPVVVEAVDFGGEFPRDPAQKAAGFTESRNTIGVRTARWKMVRYSNGEAELYDLDADPNELTNVAGDPAYAADLEQLQQAWLAYKDCQGESCRAPMAESLQRDPATTRSATDAQSRLVRAVFGLWR